MNKIHRGSVGCDIFTALNLQAKNGDGEKLKGWSVVKHIFYSLKVQDYGNRSDDFCPAIKAVGHSLYLCENYNLSEKIAFQALCQV